jgi:hypothetical protein
MGAIFLLLGLVQSLNIVNITGNAKVLFGLAVFAFCAGIGPFYNFYLLKKDAASMKPIVVSESDERNLTVRNETYARTFSILQWVITYIFFGYTWLFPKEIFVSFGWWSILVIFMSAILIKIPIYIMVNKKY